MKYERQPTREVDEYWREADDRLRFDHIVRECWNTEGKRFFNHHHPLEKSLQRRKNHMQYKYTQPSINRLNLESTYPLLERFLLGIRRWFQETRSIIRLKCGLVVGNK